MNPFQKDGRYYENVKSIDNIFNEETYYLNAVILELTHFTHFVGSLTNIDGGFIGNLETINPSFYKFISSYNNQMSTIMNHHLKGVIDGKIQIDYHHIKSLEKQTKHDIVAVQKYTVFLVRGVVSSIFMDKDDAHNLNTLLQLVHFGLTSQDIVSNVYTKMVLSASDDISDDLVIFLTKLDNITSEDYLMLGFTHGQPAVPMNIKHMHDVYKNRLNRISNKQSVIQTKFMSGAIGTNFSMNMLGINRLIYFRVRKKILSDFFGSSHAITGITYTFQNCNYYNITEELKNMLSISHILKDFSTDMWIYASKGYITRKPTNHETGSSAMPQKINPILFENAEGNLKLASALCKEYISSLEESRLQRDLSDVTMMRSVGMIFAYIKQALYSLNRALDEYEFNKDLIGEDLKNNMQVFSEYLQLYGKITGEDQSFDVIKSVGATNQNWSTDGMPQEIVERFPSAVEKIIQTINNNF